jgi:NitT/TauT family transport system ATP-binding protein
VSEPAPETASAPPPPRAGVRVRIQGVARTFAGGVVVLDGLDLDVAAGSFIALLGPSGCGKSTLLRLIAGLDSVSGGSISLEDVGEPPRAAGSALDGSTPRPAHEARHPIAYVFQDAHLLPWRRVIDNAALPLELAGVPAAERRAAAERALAEVGLADAVLRFPAELSGGMKMRVSLARALVTRPRILLLDEPFGALDELTRSRLDDQLRDLWKRLPMTVLFVTHSITEAVYLAERVVVFSKRPAKIVFDHAVDLPRERTAATRTDPAFARYARALHDALERGGA